MALAHVNPTSHCLQRIEPNVKRVGWRSFPPQPSDGGSAMPSRLSARSMVCMLWLLNSAIGARVAIREDLPGEFAGMTRWHDPSADFFRGGGTALSPGLPMMAAQAVFTVMSTRGGRAGKVGAAGLAALGAGRRCAASSGASRTRCSGCWSRIRSSLRQRSLDTEGPRREILRTSLRIF